MGRFSALILILVAACGDNQTLGPASHDPGGTNTGPGLTPDPHTVPEVCGFVQWPTTISGATAMDISVANQKLGVTVLAVPRGGGTMTGFSLDARMAMMNTGATKIQINETFQAVSAGVVGDRLLATGVDSGAVHVNLLDANLGNPEELAKIPGSFIATPSFFHADGTTVLPVAGDSGLSITAFDTAWHMIGSMVVGPSDPAIGMDAAQIGSSVLATWSTATACNLESLPVFNTGNPGIVSTTSFPCASPRIAGDVVTGTAKVVFDGGGNIRLMNIAHTQMGGDSVMLRPDAHAPRVVFDGSHYWVSYIDVRGDVVVGYLDGNNHLVSMALEGTQPGNDAYELTTIDGTPWVFAVDANGYSATHMCLTANW